MNTTGQREGGWQFRPQNLAPELPELPELARGTAGTAPPELPEPPRRNLPGCHSLDSAWLLSYTVAGPLGLSTIAAWCWHCDEFANTAHILRAALCVPLP